MDADGLMNRREFLAVAGTTLAARCPTPDLLRDHGCQLQSQNLAV